MLLPISVLRLIDFTNPHHASGGKNGGL